ncbi:PQQ-dependent sugar dehydrogenase [Alkalicaulis satelles]|uniref:PQQ-dependent sugar dehydrogenase n=1 Tax=Alkalicaulis satelles TaxID=2609175 RepID=A0A5M6Z8U6_9PROT|nr:PQQ-dependent sugar dehydrogenase [Alkalicaulis satelles]KAA5801079.1 PQQ-dependent sugar dehydrogenase [Alkalicaulis satelles]
MMRLSAATLMAAALTAPALADQVHETEQANFTVETIAQGLAFPWAIDFLPDGSKLVTERDGRLRVIEADGTLRAEPVEGLPDDLIVIRQGGLMDVQIAPDFADTRQVYFSYAQGTDDANGTALARGVLSSDMSALEDVEVLFRANFDKSRGFHFGGRILFNDDGTLFLTLGDGGRYQDEAQNPENHLGTVVRLNRDGSIPADNPAIENGAPGVFTFGHRNVQGIARNPATGSIWTSEHGPRGGDEIHILEPGNNFGWPVVTYGINYDGSIITEERERPEFVQPIWYWTPSIAPGGMAFYTGEAFEHWRGDLFHAALAGMTIQRMEVHGDRVIGIEDLLTDREQRFRDVRTGPDGFLYILVDDVEGEVLRLVPAQ